MTDSSVTRAAEFIAGSHYCDYANPEHPHKGCECPCSLCFAFWHYNIWRYEQATRIVAGSNLKDTP